MHEKVAKLCCKGGRAAVLAEAELHPQLPAGLPLCHPQTHELCHSHIKGVLSSPPGSRDTFLARLSALMELGVRRQCGDCPGRWADQQVT